MKSQMLALALLLSGPLCGCNPESKLPTQDPPINTPVEPDRPENPDTPPTTNLKGRLRVGSSLFEVSFEQNTTAAAFRSMLPMTIQMGEMNGNEKYFYLSNNLPTASSNVGSVASGDIMLFGSNCLVLFYKSFSTSYSYTPIGRVANPSQLEEALGSGSATVTFELE